MSNPMDFEIQNGVLVRYLGASPNVIIPEGVHTIDGLAFISDSKKIIESVRLPESLVTIEDMAFDHFKKLKRIVIPKNVQKIGDCAFFDCCALRDVVFEGSPQYERTSFEFTQWEADILKNAGAYIVGDELVKIHEDVTEYNVPPNIKVIGRDAFRNTQIKRVILPDGVREIGICAFFDTPLEYITLPKTLKVIGSQSFRGCKNLTELTVPQTVSSVGYRAFDNLPNCVLTILNKKEDKCGISTWSFGTGRECLKEVRVPFGSAAMRAAMLNDLRYTILPGKPRKYRYIDNVFCCKGTTLVKYLGKQKLVRVPDGIEVIANSAFSDCKMEKVYLPDSVTNIEESAFTYCEHLLRITGNGVKEIKSHAFSNCTRLKKVSFPHLEKYTDIAFEECDALKPENIFFPPDAVAFRTHGYTCPCLGCKPIRGKIHAKARTIVDL